MIGVEVVRAELHEPQVLVAEQRAGGGVRLLVGGDVGPDERAEVALLGIGLLDDLDAALAGQQLGVDDVDVLVRRYSSSPAANAAVMSLVLRGPRRRGRSARRCWIAPWPIWAWSSPSRRAMST